MKKWLWFLAFPVVLGLLCFGALWWGSGCNSVEKAVDDRKLQLRQDGEGWFVFGPPGFSQTVEYTSHLAGLLGKRISTAKDGWEKFKLASHCGGSKQAKAWSWAKNIRVDGSWGPRPVGGLLPVGGQWVIALLVVLGLFGTVAVSRRLAFIRV